MQSLHNPEVLVYETSLPKWADKQAVRDEIEVMQQALTKDGTKSGNGVIVAIKLKGGSPLITVVTETGNFINWMNLKEFFERFTLGKYVMREFPTTESCKAWVNRIHS